MSEIIDYRSLKNWPSEISQFLEKNQEAFIGWQCKCCNNSHPHRYNQVFEKFGHILRKYSIVGYHCTKLIPKEIDLILQNGMSLQDISSLSERIDRLNKIGLISKKNAEKLKSQNQANEENRAKMIWFCFFEPHIAGQSNIYRFFDCWGGEALYNSHERDPITGVALRNIGTPCIIKAKVHMNKLADYFLPDTKMFRVFLEANGHSLENPIEHEGFSIENIPPNNILEIIKYPSEKFVELTKCDEWFCFIGNE